MSQSEDEVQQRIFMEGPKFGCILLRNNSGVLKNQNGTPVRFGLGNTSSKINENLKSSDGIGITLVTITPDMVGQTIGVFTAVEVKKQDWKFNPKDKHEVAQGNFIQWVKLNGGFAGFANSIEAFREIIGR